MSHAPPKSPTQQHREQPSSIEGRSLVSCLRARELCVRRSCLRMRGEELMLAPWYPVCARGGCVRMRGEELCANAWGGALSTCF